MSNYLYVGDRSKLQHPNDPAPSYGEKVTSLGLLGSKKPACLFHVLKGYERDHAGDIQGFNERYLMRCSDIDEQQIALNRLIEPIKV